MYVISRGYIPLTCCRSQSTDGAHSIVPSLTDASLVSGEGSPSPATRARARGRPRSIARLGSGRGGGRERPCQRREPGSVLGESGTKPPARRRSDAARHSCATSAHKGQARQPPSRQRRRQPRPTPPSTAFARSRAPRLPPAGLPDPARRRRGEHVLNDAQLDG